MGRGDRPSITRRVATPPEGLPGPDKILMEHAGKGRRYIEKALVEKKEKRGWRVCGHPGQGKGLDKDTTDEKPRRGRPPKVRVDE